MASMDVLEEVTREFIAVLRRAPQPDEKLLHDIEDTLRLDGSGGALPIAISTAVDDQITIPETLLEQIQQIAEDIEDDELVKDVAELRKIAALAAA